MDLVLWLVKPGPSKMRCVYFREFSFLTVLSQPANYAKKFAIMQLELKMHYSFTTHIMNI